jgi:hypothetical protein
MGRDSLLRSLGYKRAGQSDGIKLSNLVRLAE